MSLDQKEITYSLTYKEMLEILKILDESPCQELRLELEGFKLEIIKGKEPSHPSGGVSPGPASAAPPPAPLPGGMKAREGAGPKNRKDGRNSGAGGGAWRRGNLEGFGDRSEIPPRRDFLPRPRSGSSSLC